MKQVNLIENMQNDTLEYYIHLQGIFDGNGKHYF